MAEDDEQAPHLAPRPSAALRGQAGYAVRQAPPAVGAPDPHPDGSQTAKHFPPEAHREIRHRAEVGVSAEAAESLTCGRQRFPDEDDGYPEMDDVMVSYRSTVPVPDVLLEIPEPEGVIPGGWISRAAQLDPGKPKGPNYDELRPVIAAYRRSVEDMRLKRRRRELAKSEDLDESTILSNPGRLKVAGPETWQQYLTSGRRLIERYKRECDIHISMEDIDPRDFANWLLGLKPFISPNTWRPYRAAALATVQSMPSPYLNKAVAMLNADLQIGDDDGAAVSKRKSDDNAVGASLGAKRVDYQHLLQLRGRLRVTTRSQVSAWLRDWLEAGINTGVRPMEWFLTSLERVDGRVWLHVVSARAADGHASHRTLDLSNFSTEALASVERVVNLSREWVLMGNWPDRQSDVSKLLRRLCKLMFPRMQKHYTLYSLRHQFIANMKTIYTREEVAAMADHISLETQFEHHAKKRIAWESRQIKEIPMPVDEQVAQMKRRHELFDERAADIAQKQAAKLGRDQDEDDGNEAG
jgi:hypothetical protein